MKGHLQLDRADVHQHTATRTRLTEGHRSACACMHIRVGKEAEMAKRRRMRTGYGAYALRSRLDELFMEVHRMGQDGRLEWKSALEIMRLLSDAQALARTPDEMRAKRGYLKEADVREVPQNAGSSQGR